MTIHIPRPLPFERQLNAEYRMIRRKLWNPPLLAPPLASLWSKPQLTLVPNESLRLAQWWWSTPTLMETHRIVNGRRYVIPADEETVARKAMSLLEGRDPTVRMVIRAFAEASGYPVREIIGPSRTKPMTTYRMTAIAVARQITRKSYPEIGRRFGRDHTSILHSCRKYGALAEKVCGE